MSRANVVEGSWSSLKKAKAQTLDNRTFWAFGWACYGAVFWRLRTSRVPIGVGGERLDAAKSRFHEPEHVDGGIAHLGPAERAADGERSQQGVKALGPGLGCQFADLEEDGHLFRSGTYGRLVRAYPE